MIKAIAIDDEPLALKVIETFCQKTDVLSLQKTFSSPNEALTYVQKSPVDLLFLDVQMPALSGIDFYKKLKQDTMVIFTTAYSEYAIEGFNLNAIDYLLKPFTQERFLQAVDKAHKYYQYTHRGEKTESTCLYVRADYSLIKIEFSDILYIESLDDYLKIHLSSRKPVVTRMTMKGVTELLPVKEFVRVHRSFIVPFARIMSVRHKAIFLNEIEIPIGSSYEENFFNLFKK